MIAAKEDAGAARRRDTREKIQLGGLVVKAGLRDVDGAFLLGLLAYGRDHVNDETFRERMRSRGAKEFRDDTARREPTV